MSKNRKDSIVVIDLKNKTIQIQGQLFEIDDLPTSDEGPGIGLDEQSKWVVSREEESEIISISRISEGE